MRALLADQFGVEFETPKWVTLEEAHVAGVPDPPTVRRATAGDDLMTMLRDVPRRRRRSSIRFLADPRFASVVPDPEATYLVLAASARRAHAESRRRGSRSSLADEVERCASCSGCFARAARWPAWQWIAPSIPLGFDRQPAESRGGYCRGRAQHLLAQPLTVDDLVTDLLQ